MKPISIAILVCTLATTARAQAPSVEPTSLPTTAASVEAGLVPLVSWPLKLRVASGLRDVLAPAALPLTDRSEACPNMFGSSSRSREICLAQLTESPSAPRTWSEQKKPAEPRRLSRFRNSLPPAHERTKPLKRQSRWDSQPLSKSHFTARNEIVKRVTFRPCSGCL